MAPFQQYCLRWNNHHSNLLSVFEELLHNAAFTDVTLAVDNGLTVKCHKIVLAACSTYFQNLFHDLPNHLQHPIIILKDVKFTEIKAILEYMYRGEVKVGQDELSNLLKIAQMLKVKGLVEDHSSQSDTARDLRRENTSISPPPAISTSTGAGSGCHSSPPHSTGVYSSLHGKSGISLDRSHQSHLAGPLPLSWPLLSGASHQLATVLGSGYDNIENSTLKHRKFTQSSSLINNDTPILRTVLGQAHVDSSQTMPLLQPDSHESMHYRNASSNGSANDSDNRHSNDLTHGDNVHADVSFADEEERQSSPQSYSGNVTKNSDAPKPEWKRYKQYTRKDIDLAIQAVRDGTSAVQAARRYGVPSRTLYDKVKKLGIPTSRPFKRSASNGGNGACFPYGIGANVNGTLYDNSGANTNTLSENENENRAGNVVENLAGTSTAAFEMSYAKTTKDAPQDRDSDSMARCSASPVISCVKERQQPQDLENQVEDLSVSRKSNVSTFRRVIVPPSTTSVVIKDEVQETGLDSNDCCDYS